MFRQSTKDSIVSVTMLIMGCEGRMRTFEVVVRCATLLAYADGAQVVPTSTTTAESPNGAGDGQSASAQAAVGDTAADDNANAEVSIGDDCVRWDVWGPRATAVSDLTHVGWRYLVGERRVTIEQGASQICIRDYNPYRIRQAMASMVAAKGLAGDNLGDSHEEEGTANTPHPKGTRRITEGGTIRGGEWFQDDVTTSLPHLDSEVDVPGCRAIYMEQDKILLRVDNLDKVSGISRCDLRWIGI